MNDPKYSGLTLLSVLQIEPLGADLGDMKSPNVILMPRMIGAQALEKSPVDLQQAHLL